MQLHYDADMSLINEEVVMTLNLETKSTESDGSGSGAFP